MLTERLKLVRLKIHYAEYTYMVDCRRNGGINGLTPYFTGI
jgi:hypothetical protein